MSADHSPLRAKVLTVSDGVIAGTRTDTSGHGLVSYLAEHGFIIVDHRNCSDGADVVASMLIEMCEGFTGLIVTTGGTGFAPRDQTPEGTRKLIEREAPGIAEAMRSFSPLGRLSRGVVGTFRGVLICNTPGSPKGCIEQIETVIDVLPHAVRLLAEEETSH